MLTFNDWKAELEGQLVRYNAGSFRLNDETLQTLYTGGATVDDAYGLTTDVANGFTLPEALSAWASEGPGRAELAQERKG